MAKLGLHYQANDWSASSDSCPATPPSAAACPALDCITFLPEDRLFTSFLHCICDPTQSTTQHVRTHDNLSKQTASSIRTCALLTQTRACKGRLSARLLPPPTFAQPSHLSAPSPSSRPCKPVYSPPRPNPPLTRPSPLHLWSSS